MPAALVRPLAPGALPIAAARAAERRADTDMPRTLGRLANEHHRVRPRLA